MTNVHLLPFESTALIGADRFDDDELAQHLRELVRAVGGGDPLDVQDLRELAAACLITARRMDARR